MLPRDLAGELRRTGVFGLGVPRDLGGLEADPTDLMRVSERIATADGSTGWCTMVGIANSIVSGYMPEAGAREVFADTSAPVAGIAAPIGAAVRMNGGVRVNGRWPFASGITHSDWLWAGCLVMENGRPRMTPQGPEMLHVAVPVSDVEVHDTWHVSGLCGTGSTDFSIHDVFVPDQRTFALLDPRGHRQAPLYRMPPLGIFVYQVAAVGLGIGRAALNEFTALAQTKRPSPYEQVLADKAVTSVELARAEADLLAARAFLYTTVEELWRIVSNGGSLTLRQVALGRLASTRAVETTARVADTVATLAGGSTIYSSSSLQRHARDAEVLTHHFTVSPHTWEEAGRVLLGREPLTPVF
jgi:alkylation response protein AidB-like acyl-CoA dehydrogenase